MKTILVFVLVGCCLSLSAAASVEPRSNPKDMVRYVHSVHAMPCCAGSHQLSDSGAFLLDTAVVYTPTPSEQSYPATAFDGTNFLVVWGDWGHGGVYGTRVDQSGRVLDSAGIAVTRTAYNWQGPQVAYGATSYLVVWQDYRGGSSISTYAARVSTSGDVLDPNGIVVSTAGNSQAYASVAFDGTDYLVVWADLRGGEFDIYGARVSQSGTVLDPDGIAISTATDDQLKPSVAFNGKDFAVAWLDSRLGKSWPKVYCARVSPDGDVLDPNGIALPSTAYDICGTNVTSDGVNAFVTWTDVQSDSHRVYGARVSQSGVVLDTSGIAISGATSGTLSPAAAFDGSDYLVVWSGYHNGGSDSDVFGARVSQTGVVLDTGRIAISSSGVCWPYPAVAFGGGSFLAAWTDPRFYGADIFGARVDTTGEVLDPDGVLMSMSVNNQHVPALASDGTSFLAVWQDRRDSSGTFDICGARVSETGSVLDPTSFVISADGKWSDPSVCYGGGSFLVVWEGERDSSYGIYGARVSPDGTVLDPDGIAVSSAEAEPECPAVSFDGTNFLVVWDDYRYDHLDPDICGARVGPEGVVLDTGGLIISTGEGYQIVPAVGFDGTNFLVAWSEERNPCRLRCARVSPSGVVLDSAGIDVADSAVFPSIAPGTMNTLVAWQSYRNFPRDTDDVYCARVSPSGVVLDTVEIALATAPGWQGCPVAAFDGTDFLVAWGGGGGISGARVSQAGVVFDSGPIRRQASSQALACGTNGRMLLAYQAWTGSESGIVYNAYRVWGMMDPSPGVEEIENSEVRRVKGGATVVRGVLYLRPSPFPLPVGEGQGVREWSLLDATGRKVLDLVPGANDVRALAPGVYFVRSGLSAISREPPAVTKVVVTR